MAIAVEGPGGLHSTFSNKTDGLQTNPTTCMRNKRMKPQEGFRPQI